VATVEPVVARIEAVGIARLGRELDDRGAPEPAGVLVADDVAGEGVAGLGRGLVEHGEALVPRLGEAGHVALGQAVLGEDLGTVGTMVVRRLGSLSGVHGDPGLAAVQGAELAAVAGLTGVLLALDRSRHGEPPGAGVHRWKWAASGASSGSRGAPA